MIRPFKRPFNRNSAGSYLIIREDSAIITAGTLKTREEIVTALGIFFFFFFFFWRKGIFLLLIDMSKGIQLSVVVVVFFFFF